MNEDTFDGQGGISGMKNLAPSPGILWLEKNIGPVRCHALSGHCDNPPVERFLGSVFCQEHFERDVSPSLADYRNRYTKEA